MIPNQVNKPPQSPSNPAPQVEEEKLVDGQPMPRGFKNPLPGEPGHVCLEHEIDPETGKASRGIVRRKWKSIFIHQHDATVPKLLYVCNGPNEWWCPTGAWKDVPPEFVSAMEGTTYTDIIMDINQHDLAKGMHVPVETRIVKRFIFEVRASA